MAVARCHRDKPDNNGHLLVLRHETEHASQWVQCGAWAGFRRARGSRPPWVDRTSTNHPHDVPGGGRHGKGLARPLGAPSAVDTIKESQQGPLQPHAYHNDAEASVARGSEARAEDRLAKQFGRERNDCAKQGVAFQPVPAGKAKEPACRPNYRPYQDSSQPTGSHFDLPRNQEIVSPNLPTTAATAARHRTARRGSRPACWPGRCARC